MIAAERCEVRLGYGMQMHGQLWERGMEQRLCISVEPCWVDDGLPTLLCARSSANSVAKCCTSPMDQALLQHKVLHARFVANRIHTWFSTAFRQPYNPPDKSSFLRFRFQHYQGEEHPASRKVVLSVPVSTLFETGALRTPQARHKFLLLAGSRYDSMAGRKHETQQTASDGEASNKSLGEVNISCELMPSERQNMKWCSDVLDKLIEEANVSAVQSASE